MIKKLIGWWIRANVDSFHVFLTVLLAWIWLAGWQLGSELMKEAGYYGVSALIFVHLLHWGLHSCREFLNLYEETDRLPERQIRNVCRGFLGFLLAGFLAFAAAFPHADLTAFYQGLKNAFFWLVRLIAGFFSREQGQEQPASGSGLASFSAPPWISEPGKPSLLIRILEVMLQWAVCILFVLFVLWLLYRLFVKIRSFFECAAWDTDEKVFLKPEIFTEKAGKRKEKRGPGIFGDRSYSGRIRRFYQRTLQEAAGKKRQVLEPSFTPTELEQAAGVEFSEGALHDLYEKARYSKGGASKDDWEKLKRLSRQK